ncbi:MAG: hypothetical protein EU535_00480 [Promethearchaeota archaeon]|nr:MAG: hypothetical protein EU535_00480 [Candidatus Lokiarchaeota archaeon]
MLNNQIINKITRWLEHNPKLEIQYKKQFEKDSELEPQFYYEGTLYQLWQEEAETDDNPLILIDSEKKVEIFLAISYNDEESFFEGYLICTFKNDSIIPSENKDKVKFRKELWDCSMGLSSPNEIVPYDEIKDLDDNLDDSLEIPAENVISYFVEPLYIDIFYSTSNQTYYYAYLAITDFDQRILSFEEFLDLIIDETKYTFPKYENRDDIEFTFGLYYYENGKLIPITTKNYYEIIETPGLQVFFTEDSRSALALYHEMIDERDKWEGILQKKVDVHQKFLDSIS